MEERQELLRVQNQSVFDDAPAWSCGQVRANKGSVGPLCAPKRASLLQFLHALHAI